MATIWKMKYQWQNTGIDMVAKRKNGIDVNNPNLTVETYLTYA